VWLLSFAGGDRLAEGVHEDHLLFDQLGGLGFEGGVVIGGYVEFLGFGG